MLDDKDFMEPDSSFIPLICDRTEAFLDLGEKLHSGAFQAERQDTAPPRVPRYVLIAIPFAQDCELSIPLERLRLETRRRALPVGAPLMNFQIRRYTPLFGPSAPQPFPLRGRSAQTLHFAHGF